MISAWKANLRRIKLKTSLCWWQDATTCDGRNPRKSKRATARKRHVYNPAAMPLFVARRACYKWNLQGLSFVGHVDFVVRCFPDFFPFCCCLMTSGIGAVFDSSTTFQRNKTKRKKSFLQQFTYSCGAHPHFWCGFWLNFSIALFSSETTCEVVQNQRLRHTKMSANFSVFPQHRVNENLAPGWAKTRQM